MSELLTPLILCEGVTKMFSVNSLFAGKKLSIIVVANEKAGGFTQEKQSEKNLKTLKEFEDLVKEKAVVTESIKSEVIITKKIGHGKEIAEEIATNASEEELTVIVSAGGDGTSLEIQTGLTKWALKSEVNKKKVQDKIAVFRMPLGTGNDGTDGHTLDESLKILSESIHFANARAVKFSVNGEVTENGIKASCKNPAEYGNVEDKAPWYSFNAAGIGLDAFVCWKTNEEKTKHPGNHYQLMVDFATLNYNKAFPPEDAEIRLYKDDELLDTINSAFEMCVFGVSGHRTFGSGKKIFPVEENVAIVRKLDVMTMVLKNGKFTDGSYISTNLAQTYQADKVVVDYKYPVLCELDGETHLLLEENFPVTMELTEPCIQVIESDSQSSYRGAVKK